jgi:hypothetical protein
MYMDIVSETTISYSGMMKIFKSIKILRIIFPTVSVFSHTMYKRKNQDSSVGIVMG